MKKIITLFLSVITGLATYYPSYSQQVERNFVVVEIGTGTWCTYCPGAAMGADDLVENGHQVAIIENHNGDSYAYTGSNARNTYYNISGFPTAFFDGQNAVVGGSHTQSMYPNYLPKYNQAISVMSDFILDLSYTRSGNDYSVSIHVNEVEEYAGTNLKVHLVWTESHIEQSWQGQSELNFVNRAMYPDHNGSNYSGGEQTYDIDFTADPQWDIYTSELVAFIQDNDTKEILQANKISLAEFDYETNATFVEISDTGDACSDVVTPEIRVRNTGSNPISSLSFSYIVNGDQSTQGTYDWTGNIQPGQLKIITFNSIDYEQQETNTISITITSVNGQSDENQEDNVIQDYPFSVMATFSPVNLELLTDNNASQINWYLKDSSGNTLASGSGYDNNTEYTIPLYIYADQCYEFIMYDSGGNGICCENGNGYYKLLSNGTVILEGGEFDTLDINNFKSTANMTAVGENLFDKVEIFPNPAHDRFTLINAEGLELNMFDMSGRSVLHRTLSSSDETIQLNSLSPGTYFIQLSNDVATHTQKFIIK